jgi:hypothetical protein
MSRHEFHGYLVDSDLALELPAGQSSDGPSAALKLELGVAHDVPTDGPEGAVLAELSDDGRRNYYRFVRTDSGVILRFHGTADFVADAGFTSVTVHIDPEADPALVSVLVGGPLIATKLILDGHLVLHASALNVHNGALAFVGMSGMGKSTLAALGLAAGYAPITDDVLRVDLPASGTPVVWPGSTELRLRPTVHSIVESSSQPRRTTADGRTAMSTGSSFDRSLPLRCCVIPLPDREMTTPSIRVLEPFAALQRMLQFPRIVGWRDPTTSRQQFDHLATLCERIPVIEARLPWGPPFASDLVPRLLGCIEDELEVVLQLQPPSADLGGRRAPGS